MILEYVEVPPLLGGAPALEGVHLHAEPHPLVVQVQMLLRTEIVHQLQKVCHHVADELILAAHLNSLMPM